MCDFLRHRRRAASAHRDRLVRVIAGDRTKIEPGLRELGLGEIKSIDADGNVK